MYNRVINVFFGENIVKMCWILEIDQLLRKLYLWNTFSFHWKGLDLNIFFIHSENGELIKETLIWSENKM